MVKRSDRIFLLSIAVAILLTTVFTYIYANRAKQPVAIEREEVYINFDGKTQTCMGVYYLRNRLPLNTALPVVYSFPDGSGFGDPLDCVVSLRHSTGQSPLDFVFVNKYKIKFDVALPPFGSGRLVVNYRQQVYGESLAYIVKSGNAWAQSENGITVYLKMPEGYELKDAVKNGWTNAADTDWDLMLNLHEGIPSEIEIGFTRMK